MRRGDNGDDGDDGDAASIDADEINAWMPSPQIVPGDDDAGADFLAILVHRRGRRALDPTVAEVGGEVEVDEGDVAGGRAHRDVLGLDVAVREARDGVHRVERRRELREVEARLGFRQAASPAVARGAKVRAKVPGARAHRRHQMRVPSSDRRRRRGEVEIVEAREERARCIDVVVVVVVSGDRAAGAVERAERSNLRGDA